MDSPVSEFYCDKNVFITGVTGFLAKSVVEKLLRRTNVNKIYVLIREKKGKSINERMDDIKRNPVRPNYSVCNFCIQINNTKNNKLHPERLATIATISYGKVTREYFYVPPKPTLLPAKSETIDSEEYL